MKTFDSYVKQERIEGSVDDKSFEGSV